MTSSLKLIYSNTNIAQKSEFDARTVVTLICHLYLPMQAKTKLR